MHVLMLCALEVWALPGQGGAPSLYKTVRAYSERGHRVTFVGPTIGANALVPPQGLRAARRSDPPALPRVVYQRVHLPSLRESRLPLPGAIARTDQKLRFALGFPYLAARRAARIMAREHVDLLYAYEVHGALAARLLQRRHELPTVARFQGTVLHPYLDSRFSLLRRYEEVLAMRTPADLYIMTNDGTQGDKVLARLNPRASDKLCFWRNGIDLNQWRPAEPEQRRARRQALRLPDDAFVLLTASRLARWKRVDRAVAALPAVLSEHPHALLLVVGDGEERENLDRQARSLGVGGNVRFAGAVPQEDVAGYMQAADVFLAPADLSNVGNPLLEAMCTGLPVVAVDAGDTGDLVRDGETGRLLATGNPTGIARAVTELANEASLRCRLASGARAEAEARFWTWQERLDAELEAVEGLVPDKAGAPTP